MRPYSMKVLVTGGAGYIGSVVAERLLGRGNTVVVLDSLVRGHRMAVPNEAEFIRGDLRDRDWLCLLYTSDAADE